MLAMSFAYPLLMQRVWKVFNFWRRPPEVVVIMPFVAVPCLLGSYESNWRIFAFEQEDPDVLCCCVNDEEVTAVVAIDDGFLWGCAVMEYFLEMFGSLDEAKIHGKQGALDKGFASGTWATVAFRIFALSQNGQQKSGVASGSSGMPSTTCCVLCIMCGAT
jgi:hypothetical protein